MRGKRGERRLVGNHGLPCEYVRIFLCALAVTASLLPLPGSTAASANPDVSAGPASVPSSTGTAYYEYLDSITELSVASLAGFPMDSGLDSSATKLKGSDWFSDAQKDLAAREYRVSRDKKGAYQAPNRAQNLRARFTAEGVTLSNREPSGGVDAAEAMRLLDSGPGEAEKEERRRSVRHDDFSVSLNFSYIGRQSRSAETLRRTPKAKISTRNARAELARGAVTEWYENRAEGIEQGFTVSRRPGGSGNVVLAQEISGATVRLDGKTGATFKSMKNKKTLFTYANLRVEDASGRELSSHMQLKRGELRIVYSDKGASYPVTVDPLITTPAAIIEKDQAGANLGVSVAAAGDVNGDGYSDVIVGAHKYDNGQADEGAAFVYHGSASGISASPSATVEGNQADAWFGGAVSGAGDVNGDGYSDVIVGAYYYDNGQTDEGAVFVYHGSATGISTTPAAIAESNQASAWMGMAVSGAGDVNGDGYSDVIAGATQYDNGHADEGTAFVYHGSSSGISTTPAAMVESNQASAFFGRSASGAGDVNGDGYSDVVVGANYYDNGQDLEGAAFVYHGSASGISTTPAATVESNQIGGRLGIASSSAGDVNGDGYSDVIVGSYLYDNGQVDEGAAFIYHGSASGISTTAAAMVESNQASAQFGISVAYAGDVNGDGYADVIAAAWYYDNGQTNEGATFVYHGSASGLSTTATAMVETNQDSASMGYSVAGAGDINGDGFSDVIAGAFYYDNGQADEGAAFVYHGSPAGISTTPAATLEKNQATAYLGYSLAGAGDVNGDGFSDVIVGAFQYDSGQSNEGAAFVYHGSATGISSTPAATLERDQADANVGLSVSSAGDVNGDGYSDVIVGAYQYDNGQAGEGAAFLYYGSASGVSTTPAATIERNQADAFLGISVSSAGDVNGDGYSDVIVGAHKFDNGETDEGSVFVYHGSASGIPVTPDTAIESNQVDAILGVSATSAGDVNGDGYSDVIVGSHFYDSGQSNEGKAFVYHGSASGVSTTPAASVESNQVDANMARSVSTAGDVNGDGYSDVIVAAYLYDNGQSNEGLFYVYHGSASGISTTPAATVESNQATAYLGTSVSSAGDVNGDGYSDVIVGAYAYDNGQTDEGAAFIYHGSASGISSAAAATLERNQIGGYVGCAVASAGDVNGDGYSDVIVGAYGYDNGQSDEGAAFVYHGNGSGKPVLPRQRRGNDSAPIHVGLATDATGDARIKLTGRTPLGRGKVKLEWELKPFGTAFNGAGTERSTAWTDTGTSDVTLNEPLSGLAGNTAYHWRARLVYSSATGIPQSAGRWVSPPGNAATEIDFRTFSTTDLTDPVTTLSTSPVTTDGEAGWFNTSPVITLTSDESGFTGYRWDGAAVNTNYSSSFAYDQGEGAHTLYYQSTDDAGNTEDSQSRLFKVDTAAPTNPVLTSSSHATGVYSGDNTIQIDFGASSDATSGVSGFSYGFDTSASTVPDTTVDAGVTSATSAELADGTSHYFHLRTKDTAGNWSAAIHSGPYLIDIAPPSVDSTTPLDDAIWVSAGTNVIVVFSEDMSADTITDSSFTLKSSTNDPVAASLVYDAPSKTATLNPSAQLLSGQTYAANLTADIKDQAGRALAPATFSFTTVPDDVDPPTTPSLVWSQVASPTEVNLHWSAASDDRAVTSYRIYDNDGALVGSSQTTRLQLSSLTPGQVYRYRVKASDQAGNLSGYSSTIVVETSYSGDTDAGAAASAATIAPSASVSITFDDVTADGVTTAGDIESPASAPSGYGLVGSVFDISTTAGIGGYVTVGISYSESDVYRESSLALFHYEGGAWRNVTLFVDTANNVVFGRTTSLSPFVVGDPGGNGGWWKESSADPLGSADWQDQVGNTTYSSPHGGFTTTSNLCKTCHAIHGANQNSFRLLKSGNTTETRTSGENFGVTGMGSSRANECMYCHDANAGLSSKKPYELGATPGTVVLGEHSLGATDVPDSDVNGGSGGSGNLADRGGPYVDGKQVLICYSCHSVHGANVVGQDNNHDGTLDSPNAVSGNSLFEGKTFDAGDDFENWNTKILRIDPANDGSILATGSQGAMSQAQWVTEMGMSTADGGALAVRTGFCADCHNKNPNWETDTSDARPNPKSHPQGRGTDSMVDAYGVSVEVAAHPLEKMGCRGCHFATNNSTRPGPSRFPHQSVGYKLLYDEATQDAVASDTGNPYRAVNRMDSICLSCHRIGVEPMGGYDEQEEAACLECHDSKYGAPDIGDEIRKTYAMPIVATHDVHTNDEAQSASSFTYAAKRHVECVDCHNPKRIYPWVDNPLTGIWGLQPTYVTTADYSFTPISQVTKESQLCYKCHATGTGWSLTLPPSMRYFTTVSASPNYVESVPRTQGNKGAEFNTNNSAFHPVEGAGRNLSRSLCKNLESAFNLDCSSSAAAQTSLGGIRLKCTDCHNNNELVTAGVRGSSSNYSGASPTGPHGSTNIAILRGNYNRNLSYPRSAYNANDFALCYSCHDPNVLLGWPFVWDATPGPGATNFYAWWVSSNGSNQTDNLHYLHLTGSGVRAKCADCHYNIHSNQEGTNTIWRVNGVQYSTLGPPSGTPTRMINFAPHIQRMGLNARPRWDFSSATKVRYCYLNCHVADGTGILSMNGYDYRPPAEWDLP